MTDATAEDLLGGFKRERKSAEVEGVGTIYYYDPPSVAERNAFYRHVMHSDRGMVITLDAFVDGVIARAKDANSRPLFKQIHRARFFEMPEDRLKSIWRAMGGEEGMDSAEQIAEGAEKK